MQNLLSLHELVKARLHCRAMHERSVPSATLILRLIVSNHAITRLLVSSIPWILEWDSCNCSSSIAWRGLLICAHVHLSLCAAYSLTNMPFAFHESCMHHRKSKRIMYASIPTHPDIGSDTRIPPIQSYIFKHLPRGSPWGFGPLQGHADPRHRKVFFHQYDQCAIDIKSQAQVAFSAQVLCTIVQTGRSSWLRQTPPLTPLIKGISDFRKIPGPCILISMH